MEQSAPRYPIIDAARGVALVAMAIYHFAWDLRFFGLIQTDVVRHPLWSLFAKSIAASFLVLVGISLVLATQNGLNWSRFLRRLALVGGAALLVTLGTRFATPESYIFFGILHAIAVGSILALPFLKLPLFVIIASAGVVLVLPKLLVLPAFDHWSLQWLGLGQATPLTNDFIPVFPWFGFILLGLIAGRLLQKMWQNKPVLDNTAQPIPRLLAKTGKHSLAVYLLHQPVLIGLVAAAAFVLSPAGDFAKRPDATALEFRSFCQDSCLKSGGTSEICPRYCSCAERDIKQANLWTPLLSNTLSDTQRSTLKGITDQCTAVSRE
jgi:uncharacterized membrane protein